MLNLLDDCASAAVHLSQVPSRFLEHLMVFPISHEHVGRRSVPWMNYLIIGLNLFVFLVPQQLGNNEDFTYKFSVVPEKIVTGQNLAKTVEIVNPITKEKIGEIKE